jgi:peptidoglycan biosynthesis protein MviN/MurJ (putative lipid II flippase)
VALSVVFTLLTGGLYLLLAPRWGIAGLSWAMALSTTGQMLVLLVWLRRAEGLNLAAISWHAARVSVAALLAVSVAVPWVDVWVLRSGWSGWWGAVLTLAVGGGVTLIGYVGLAYLFGIPEVRRRSKP